LVAARRAQLVVLYDLPLHLTLEIRHLFLQSVALRMQLGDIHVCTLEVRNLQEKVVALCD